MDPDSQSAQDSEMQPASGEAHPSAASSGKPRQAAALSRELADFLVEFSIVLHKRSMYPAGHPHLNAAADRFVRRINALLNRRVSVTLGVARYRLVIENVTTDPNNALLRDLAHRLHRHRIVSVHLTRGVTLQEIEGLLAALSADPQRGDGPVGKRLGQVGAWDHIRLQPVGYDKLSLQDPDPIGEPESDEPASNARDGWIELAQLALSTEEESSPSDADPLVVAEVLDRKSGEVAYDRVVLGYLARIAQEMSGRRGAAEEQLLLRISKLIEALDPATLRRLLEAGADAERTEFALNASQILAADAVMEVVEAAAQVSHQTISHNLLRLLHKLAHHAEEGPVTIRAEAEGALRRNVARLIGDWGLEDPNPAAYNAVLESMVRRSSAEYSLVNLQVGYDPEIILKMAVELGSVGPAVYAAVEQLLSRRELVRIAQLLKAAPLTDATEALWLYLATPERLEMELAASPLDQDAVAILVERLGTAAASSLLDCLGSAEDRSTRAAIMKQLLALGPGISSVLIGRLDQAPWFLQRNILVLLGRLGSPPSEFSATTYATNPDPRIRREAIKLLLESKDHQEDAIVMGLGDADEGIVGLALAAAPESYPPRALPLVQRIAVDPKRQPEVRTLAVRIVTRAREPEARLFLLKVIGYRRRWFRSRLAPKSPDLLAALAGLATHWSEDPLVKEVLAYARWHTDRQIRAAAAAKAL